MKNLKLILSAAVGSAMLGIGAASAADLPMKAMAPIAPPFSWTGFYIGGNVGAGVLLDQGIQLTGLSADRHGVGGLAGGQIGYNWQMGMLVLGIEGEGFWSGMRINVDQFSGNNLILNQTIKNKWDYDIAARFGIAIDRALVYGKAGWVAARFDWNASEPNFCGIGCSNTTQGSATLDGLLIGLGLEYAFTNNWTTKFEYDYLGFGSKNVAFTSSCPSNCVTLTQTQNVSADKHIFKVGFNYLFNAASPVIAKY